MTYNGATMTGRAPTVFEFGAFPEPPNPLFRDYVAGAPAVGPFFDGARWDLDAVTEAAARTLRRLLPRAALAEILVRQQRERGAERAAAAAARIAEADTTAVVTGQQPALFGGPLYVLYKALAAQKLAATLEARRGRPVAPVFWVAGDDHDFAEVRATAVLDASGAVHELRYAPGREPVGEPAARIALDDTIGALLEELAQRLPEGPHRDSALALLRECYRPGVSLASAFASLLARLLPGLVVLDPTDPAFKALMRPVMERELDGSPTSRLAAEAGERLLAAGYHQQVPVRPGFLNLFLLAEGQRCALAQRDGVVEVRGTGRSYPAAEVARLLESDPAAFSPGALLRPLAQDAVLPTAAYVGGPAEIAYHAQVRPCYAAFGVPAPVLLPRPSVTLVEPAQARALAAEALTLPELQRDPEALVARWAREAHPQLEQAFERAQQAVDRELAAIAEQLAALDATLTGAAEAARGRALHPIEVLHEKALRALKKRDHLRGERIRRTRDALFPGGSWQERGLGIVHLLARHGPAVAAELGERIELFARGHQVLQL
jgi:bacillithiol biosynthesis cysteine-adding enzyme BshC